MSSQLDYCNSPLYGIADIDLTRLQRVQNRLPRIVTKSPPFTRTVPLLHSLPWLPVKFTILFNINLLTYKTCHESTLFIFTPCLPHHCHPVHWDQTKGLVCQSLETSEDTSLWPGLSPLDTGTLDSPLMPWNWFIDFAIEHWFSSCATEPGFSRYIGTIKIWLIDWLIKESLLCLHCLFSHVPMFTSCLTRLWTVPFFPQTRSRSWCCWKFIL